MNDSFYKSVVENSPVGYACHKIICDENGIPCDYQFIEVNSAFEKFTGIKGSEIINQKITHLIPEIRKETNDWIGYYGDIALNGGKKEYEQFSVPMNKWYRVIVYCLEKGYFATCFMDFSQENSQSEELNNFFDLNLDLLCIADNVGNFIKTNRAWETTLGYSSGELSKMKFLDFVHPDDMAITLEAMKLLNGHCDISNFGNRYLCKDGSYHWFEWRSHSQGKLNYSIARDITSRKKSEKIIFDEKELFKTTLLSVCDGVIATDRKGRITIINKVAETLTGWSHEAAYGQPLEKVFHIIDEFTRERCASPIFEVLKTGSIIELASHRILVSRDNNELPIKDNAAPIKDENGNIKGMVLVFRDVSDQKQKEDEILHLSYHDYLTGIYNRRFYEKELIRLDTIQNLPLTLLIGDVNGLKLINDSLGHAMGDELLKA